MGKLIHSPVDKFPGDVTLYDPVPYPAYIAWGKALAFAGDANNSEKQQALFKGVRAMTEKWSISGFDIDNPHAAPNRQAIINLLKWLVDEIGILIAEDIDPN